MPVFPYYVAGYEFGAEELAAAVKALGYENMDTKETVVIGWSCAKIGIHLGCDILTLADDPDDTWSYFISTRGSRRLGSFPWPEHEKDREVKVKAQALGIKCEEFKNLDYPKVL
ncbi:hypothetical protein FRC11_011297 [Ceratobasidium sp. 423]|nr:hypothetical protein FRC11_011297 [Ceratobasidium sp. 423]